MKDRRAAGAIVRLEASLTGDLHHWILGLGRYAVALEPEELGAQIEEEAQAIVHRLRSADALESTQLGFFPQPEGKTIRSGR